jgi:hypothetical protein
MEVAALCIRVVARCAAKPSCKEDTGSECQVAEEKL